MKKKLSRDELKELAFLDVSKDRLRNEQEFYKSKEWMKARESYLIKNVLCELCLNEDKKIKSSIVHHIIPLTKGGQPLSEDNLIALCKKCHSEIHSTIGVSISLVDLLNSLEEEDEWWEPPDSYITKDRQTVRYQMMEAEKLEKIDPEKAVSIYENIMNFLEDFDNLCTENNADEIWRITRYPINRLTLVLERQGKYSECLQKIKNYEKLNDEVGLTTGDRNSLKKRKIRIQKKLKNFT
jgi:5-methylcytosine-specific restriction protein A